MSESGRGLNVARGVVPHGSSYSITVMTSLTHPNGFVVSTPRIDTNTAETFFMYVIDLISNSDLVSGDILIVDNASIHYGADIRDALDALLGFCNIELIFLPTYSPELNPVELVFARLKHYIRHHRTSRPLLADLADACNFAISWANIVSFYYKCLVDFIT